MLDGKLNQEKIIDDRKREHGRIEKGNEKKPRRAETAGESHHFLLPSAQTSGQRKFLRAICCGLFGCGMGLWQRRMRTDDYCAKAARSKWFINTCMSAVRCKFGSLGTSPITRTWPKRSMVSRFSRF